mmetsp:Transcript_23282/g.55180  ORF Transcript_23282/g.55180 Transcript_23282/m.55180 type:complete len:203 (+) Transcript_23282:254-862(+)|eukprot:CAMPEP_0113484016 /NCGR_PEP_ID=MMETSP0014_2-20120614/23738_1 /TAXON_ID=2857 /ORGANISM="Nitzschia sp." /LENGTH=202 /DNA_ID=CAMNT_0000377593 /DNA_START=165 /DNA_END=773 /DNA_ORIENTATION=- /assembly_acc=CAM_ASM_000159
MNPILFRSASSTSTLSSKILLRRSGSTVASASAARHGLLKKQAVMMISKNKKKNALIVAATQQQQQHLPYQQKMSFSDNITYSGGHASDGQGGFYASFNRASGGEQIDTDDQRKNMLAMAADVQKVSDVMKELETLEGLLQRESDPTTGRSIEIKAGIKKLMTNQELLNALDRLETNGGPVWGLSSEERDLIIEARDKVNEC